ncbi:TreB [Staphylococcus phage MSA6]|uniref:TreB n=1 Tax=Staphylococcus phage MSA6 TaxID=1195079 RepID=I6WKM6_9CAUD|nr:TreB [Staphylococcus phage MSA6]YP_009781598.1 TreB [Staphylococcus phage MSA6]AFN38648.1 TreB [Staphylococcus phage MSA6]AHL83275.1 TreB [Staphylococcus phage MSA6]
MIGITILITIMSISTISMYIYFLVDLIQSIRYNSFDKVINIITFVLMTVIIASGILAILGI